MASPNYTLRFFLAGLAIMAAGVALGFILGDHTNGPTAKVAVVLALTGLLIGFLAVLSGSLNALTRFWRIVHRPK